MLLLALDKLLSISSKKKRGGGDCCYSSHLLYKNTGTENKAIVVSLLIALFFIAKMLDNTICLSIRRRLNKSWFTYTIEYWAYIKE